jgi:hypothetical protein
MKLVRPDVFHPRIVLVGGDGDDAGLVAALRRRGLHAVWQSWDDPDTLRADLVILRARPDAGDRLDEFLDWTKCVRRLLNGPDVIAWNTGEHYLRDLHRVGVPTVSSRTRSATTALVFFGGAQSHAFTTAAMVEPDFELWDLGRAALQAAAELTGIGAAELLYARADVIGSHLAGLDLVAPSLGWRQLDDGTRELQQRAFALSVESALQRLGLGPLSHRRP